MSEEIARLGEDIAAAAVKEAGYTILARNFRCRQGELDIVAQKGQTVAFIEVKTRSHSGFGQPHEAVTYGKKQRIQKAAAWFAAKGNLDHCQFRFDVISVSRVKEEWQAQWFKDAFIIE